MIFQTGLLILAAQLAVLRFAELALRVVGTDEKQPALTESQGIALSISYLDTIATRPK